MQVTDGNRNIVASYKYDAWGNDLTDPQSPIPNPFKYVGGLGYYADKESGLMLLGVRYYSASVGRFWSLDPARDRINRYIYVLNNPTGNTDPSGLQADLQARCQEICEDEANRVRLFKRCRLIAAISGEAIRTGLTQGAIVGAKFENGRTIWICEILEVKYLFTYCRCTLECVEVIPMINPFGPPYEVVVYFERYEVGFAGSIIERRKVGEGPCSFPSV